MNSTERKTAKIYAFPVRRSNQMAARLARLEEEARRHPKTEFGSGWYHDEAIADPDGHGAR